MPVLNGPMVLTALPDAATAAQREAGWLQGQGQIQDGGDLAWQAWSWLPGTTAPAWEYPEASYTQAWNTWVTAARSGSPLVMGVTVAWDRYVANAPPGSQVSLDQIRRSVEFAMGVVNTVTGNVLQTTVGRFLLLGPASLLLPAGAVNFGGYVNTQGSAYTYGTYAGQAVNIALTLYNPAGALGTAKSALMLVQLAGAVGEGVDAYAQGRTADAALAAVNVAMAGFHALGPCTAGVLVGKLAGSKAVGASASALVGTVAAWSARGLGALGAAVGGVNAIERIRSGDIIGGALGLLQSGADLVALTRSCFTAEMLLDCEEGKKRADTIQVGDKLWSRSEFEPHGPIELKDVEEVFVRTAPIWNVHVAGQIIRTTGEHPFWVLGRGWIPAQMLEIGDLLSTRGGDLVPVEGVAQSGAVETVYNWRIGEYHTYFVGTEWGLSVWAHNSCYEVGTANNLRKTGRRGTQVNHTPQSREAELLVGSFNPKNKVGNEPGIRLPISEHEAVTAAQAARSAPASARDLLASDIRILKTIQTHQTRR